MSATSHQEDDVVSESILSLSKDTRYIQQCQELLQEWLRVYLEPKESRIPEQEQALKELRRQGTWLVSSLFYLIMSTRAGRTLGMKVLGLDFSKRASSPRFARFLWIGAPVLVAAISSLGWEYARTLKELPDRQRNPQQVRGEERRLIHDRLRRQMLERASGVARSPSLEEHQTSETVSETLRNESLAKRISSVVRQLSTFVFDLYSESNTGPHEIVQTSTEESDASGNANRSALYSVALWMIRLHFAQYLVTGKYPTLLHRFLGIRPEREQIDGRKNESAAIVSRPNTNKVIGLLIFLQAGTTLAQKTFHYLAKIVAKYLEARAAAALSSATNKNREDRIRKRMEIIFGHDSKMKNAKLRIPANPSDQRVVCTICRMERKHPAAPATCGHVCCWQCLIQWVSTVRPECPLCRAPCQPNEVIALHNYDPSL